MKSSDNILNKRGFVIFFLFNLFIISHHSPDIPNKFYFSLTWAAGWKKEKPFVLVGRCWFLQKIISKAEVPVLGGRNSLLSAQPNLLKVGDKVQILNSSSA